MGDRYEALKERNLFEELIALRDRQRADAATALPVVEGAKLPVELSRWGRVQWYMHPAIHDTATRAQIMWVMRIAPGSRTGKLSCQGGHIYYVWKGSGGHTVLDGERHDWDLDSVIDLPLRPAGIVYQHFNDGDDEVVLVGTQLNLVDAVGVDAGTSFEVLEPCPEWVERPT